LLAALHVQAYTPTGSTIASPQGGSILSAVRATPVAPSPQPPRLLEQVRQAALTRFGRAEPGERYADGIRRHGRIDGKRPHMRAARAEGADTDTDLTDVFIFPTVTEVVARELEKRLGLLYTSVIRRLCDRGIA
jgi:hypothetical protein